MNATFTQAEIAELLPVVMNFKSLRGLSTSAALEAAKARYEALHAVYKLNALDRRNEVAFCEARANVRRCALVIEVLEAAIEVEAAQKVAKRESRARCSHYKAIRRAFAVAREAGLDTRADEAMRAAFSRILGRVIESREAMNGADWMKVGDQIKARRLAW